ncbi:hypothetical protein A6R68_01553, partial [Neotoma lepida]
SREQTKAQRQQEPHRADFRWLATVLTQKTLQNHANQNIQIFKNFKNTSETAQTIKGMHTRKATKYRRYVTLKKSCVPFQRYNGRVGMPRPNIIEHSKVRKNPICTDKLTVLMARLTHTCSSSYIETILTGEKKIIPKPEEKVEQEKKISQKKLKKQKLMAQEAELLQTPWVLQKLPENTNGTSNQQNMGRLVCGAPSEPTHSPAAQVQAQELRTAARTKFS